MKKTSSKLEAQIYRIIQSESSIEAASKILELVKQQMDKLEEALGDEEFDDPITEEHMTFIDKYIGKL